MTEKAYLKGAPIQSSIISTYISRLSRHLDQ